MQPVTMSSFDRPRAERGARTVLLAGLAPILPAAALLLWILGFEHRPHHVVLGIVVAVAFCIVTAGTQLFLYRNNMKRIAKN